MSPHSPTALSEQMLHRIRGEFLEMPGLRLTLDQARRLWALDEDTCARLLEALTQTGFLVRSRHGTYMRLMDGTPVRPTQRVVKASLDRFRAGAVPRSRAS